MIDIIIPTYNRADCITKAIASCGKHPVIVVDDGSTDDTEKIVSKCKRVTYVKLEHTGLPGFVKDAGVQAGKSEYFCILDSDDMLMPNAVEKMERYLEKKPALAYTQHIKTGGKPGFNTRIQFSDRAMQKYCPIFHMCCIRRDVYEQVGGYDKKLVAAVDTDLYVKIYNEFPKEILFVQEPLYYYNTSREDRVSVQRKKEQDKAFREAVKKVNADNKPRRDSNK